MKAMFVSLVLTMAAITGLRADIIYSQGFDSPDTGGGDGDALGLYNWATHRNQNGVIAINGEVGWPANPVAAVSSAQVRVVDDGANAPSPSDRVYTFWNDDTSEALLHWTDDFTAFALSAYGDLTIRWHHRNTNQSGGLSEPGTRAAVAIFDGFTTRWFASDTLLLNTSATWQQESVALADPVWIEFTFDGTISASASAGFSLGGGAAALPDGNVVAAGIYAEYEASGINGDSVRFDSFLIEGMVPEPGTLALLGLGVGLAAWRRRAVATR